MTTDELRDLRTSIREWEDWSNELAMLLPEDAETWPGANPEGAQESIITACLTHLLRQVEAVQALHRPWYEVNGKRHDHLVTVCGSDLPDGHVFRVEGPEYDRCDPIDRENPEDSLHSVPACYECRCATDEGEPGYLLWPCDTARALGSGAA